MRERDATMPATQTVPTAQARELLTTCCARLGRNRFDMASDSEVSPAQSLFRAELMVRDAFDAAGDSYDTPSINGVFAAADVIARNEAVDHPGLGAQLGQLSSYLMQRTCS